MKSTLGYKTRIVTAGKVLEVMAYGRTFFCQTVSGSITVELDDRGEKLPCFNKQGLKLGPGDYFKKLTFENSSASDVTVTFWTGDADIISQGVSASAVDTGIVNFGDTWTNNTGSPVVLIANVHLQSAADYAEVTLNKNGNAVASARLYMDASGENNQTVSTIVLPGDSVSVVNASDPEAANSLLSVESFALS